jgi:hypothetical protein
MIAATAERFVSRFDPRIRALSAWIRNSTARRVGRPLDNAVERGYERPLTKDVMMASYIKGLAATTLETIRGERATVRRTTVCAKQAVA